MDGGKPRARGSSLDMKESPGSEVKPASSFSCSTYFARHLFGCTKFQHDVFSYQHKRSPVLHFAKSLRFSHPLHGFVQGFTDTFTFCQVCLETFHELQSGVVVNRPLGHQNSTSTGTQKCTCNTNNPLNLNLPTATNCNLTPPVLLEFED